MFQSSHSTQTSDAAHTYYIINYIVDFTFTDLCDAH